ncbi:TetR/AcrR family transcriptional regulator [Microterricola viridarii]|uniref:TetR/AcrR family transcriptional regulator n=1 Tax=Microterricola viridarii TaxID=412690 RepID=UPI001F314524|nr:TetR/AcrR family transcriptional regulator [Microterricola viridarii]
MSTPSPTRDRLLDAFEALLIEQGEKAATLDAVAARAGVSKGGLLYHFGSKDALVTGQLTRLAELATTDVENIRHAPAGSVDYLIRTSVNTDTPLDRAIIAAACLAQGTHPAANEALAALRQQWLAVVEEAVGDPDVAEAILLVSDGLYYNSALANPMPSAGFDPRSAESTQQMDRLLAVLAKLLD